MKVRLGQCTGCGECCKYVGFVFKLSPAIVDWADARELPRRLMPDENVMQVMLPNVCPHLRDGTSCDLHGAEKPSICRNFPTAPEELLPGCGFYFEEVLND